MDMSMGMEPDSAIANLPISDPRCIEAAEMCTAFYAAENASQAVTPWAGQFEYGHWVTYFYACIIFVLAIVHGMRRWRDHTSNEDPSWSNCPSLQQKVVAFGRYIAYKRIDIVPREFLETPSIGMLAFFLASCIILAAYVFATRPYYRPHLGYGSPPIAIRSGLMAFACIPILTALAGKANIVTLLTGISHEKLNIVHQFVAWVSLVLSAIHTIPFFLASYQDEGAGGYKRVKKEFYSGAPKMGANQYSGVPPFAILFTLCVLSLPYLRRHFYESFYAAHILLGITYVGLLFWHASNEIDSWAYLWATIALWLVSWLARAFWFTRPLKIGSQWLRGSPTSITKLPGDMTRVEILAPKGFRYEPAQHCFLRFPTIAPFDNHPFTICSVLSQADQNGSREVTNSLDDPRTMTFLVRTHAGFTRKITSYYSAERDRMATAWIDGPYGGIRRPLERLYDHLILVAGGSGISACLPWMLHCARLASADIRLNKVTLIWAMRRSEHLQWVERELQAASMASNGNMVLDIKLFVTNGVDPRGKFGKELEKIPEVEVLPPGPFPMNRNSDLGNVFYGRPIIADAIKDVISEASTVVIGCGPISMRKDLANACAEMQFRVIKGEIKALAIYLEEFGW